MKILLIILLIVIAGLWLWRLLRKEEHDEKEDIAI